MVQHRLCGGAGLRSEGLRQHDQPVRQDGAHEDGAVAGEVGGEGLQQGAERRVEAALAAVRSLQQHEETLVPQPVEENDAVLHSDGRGAPTCKTCEM